MVLNYVNDECEISDLLVKNVSFFDDKEEMTVNEIKQKAGKILQDYKRLMEECYKDDSEKPEFCSNESELHLSIALAKFLADCFYTRDNNCFIKYSDQKKKGKGYYYFSDFKGIMIHSPASCKSALKTRDDFNKYSKMKVKESKGTHFIVDGDTGYIFCLLPMDCRADHCGKPTEKVDGKDVAIKAAKSFNETMFAIDIGEPGGVISIPEKQADSFSDKTYLKKYWRKSGHHYYGIAERINNKQFIALSKEEQDSWVHSIYTDETTNKTSDQYFRSNDDFVKKVQTCVKTAYHSAAELAAGICYLYGYKPLHMGKKLDFSDKKTYKKTDIDVYDRIIGHNEGYENFRKAKNHGDPENLWEMECVDIDGTKMNLTMDSFRNEVFAELQKLKKRIKPINPMLACLARRWKEAEEEKDEEVKADKAKS